VGDGVALAGAGVATDGVSVDGKLTPDVSGVIAMGADVVWSTGVLSPAAAASGVPGAGGVTLPATAGGLAPPTPNQTTS
jgi:hypothetical protein